MLRLLYDALLALALPWVWARLHWKARSEPAYGERIGERFGRLPAQLPQRPIWFHTVSAGETNAAAPVIRRLHERLPDAPLLVTTMTPTGAARVEALLADIATHCYAPYDYPWAVKRFLRRVQPRALVLMETELWPNLIRQTADTGAGVYLVNARLSERSYRGYRRVGSLTRTMLRRLGGIACQDEDAAARFRALGASAVTVTGSVKFDAALPPDAFGVQGLDFDDAPTWIAGSTHDGEETIVLDAHIRLLERWPTLRLILVPRHPARVQAVARLVEERGLTYGQLSERQLRNQVLLGDVMGTLAHLYGRAQVAFVGGTLDRTGGHNPIEAAAHGLPMLMGPARFKIEDIAGRFAAAGCLHEVSDAAGLGRGVAELLADDERRSREGEAARRVVAEGRGATDALVEQLCAWLR